jgi:hypothetical protein
MKNQSNQRLKPFYLNNKLPELFLNQEMSKHFLLPFNVAGALFLVEKQKYTPLWATTSLLQLTNKDIWIEKKSKPKLEFLIENKILPGFTLENFKSWINHSIKEGREIHANYSHIESESTTSDSIESEYYPKFIPLFNNEGNSNHVFFLLEPKNKTLTTTFNKMNELLEEIDAIKNINKQLLEANKIPSMEVNCKLKIEYFNKSVELLFPEKKLSRCKTFLDIWNIKNKTKVLEAFYKTQNSKEEELTIFEELAGKINKIRIHFKIISTAANSNSKTLVTIENLNLENDTSKELTKKGFLLQSTQVFSYDLEDDEINFIKKSSTYLLQNFELKGMYLVDFKQQKKVKTLITFPKKSNEAISQSIFEEHLSNFKPILKRNVKHVLTDKIFDQEMEYPNNLRKSMYLLGIPLYEGETQVGVMVYPCDSKKIDIDSLYQLYSLTTLFFKIFNYQNTLMNLN